MDRDMASRNGGETSAATPKSAAPLPEIGWRYPGNVDDELGFPCVLDHDDLAVCSVLDDGIDEVQQKARCHLIAAAPEMYEALDRLQQAAADLYGSFLDGHKPLALAAPLAAAIAALAKASGQEGSDQ